MPTIRFHGIWGPRTLIAKVYIDSIVDPLLRRFEKEPLADDLAVAATVALWHTFDHFALDWGCTLAQARAKVRDIEPRIDYLHAAATINKHRKIESSPAKFKLSDRVLQRSITISACMRSVKKSNSTPPCYIFNDGENCTVTDLLTECRLAVGNFV